MSVGKLYKDMADHETEGQTYSLWRYRGGREGEGYQLVESKIIFERYLDQATLIRYFTATSKAPENYHPDEDIRILNLISWASVNDGSFGGGRVGKKSYESKQNPKYSGTCPYKKRLEGGEEAPVPLYNIKTGFFTSMRPSYTGLLLNVNSTTSAFYPPWNLQEWINKRWPQLTPSGQRATNPQQTIPSNGGKDLKGLRVTFEGDEGPTRAGKKRVIWSASDVSVKEQKFDYKDKRGVTSKISVHEYIKKSEFRTTATRMLETRFANHFHSMHSLQEFEYAQKSFGRTSCVHQHGGR